MGEGNGNEINLVPCLEGSEQNPVVQVTWVCCRHSYQLIQISTYLLGCSTFKFSYGVATANRILGHTKNVSAKRHNNWICLIK